MKTTRQAKDNDLRQPLENYSLIVDVFGDRGPVHIADIGACDGLSAIKYCLMFPNSEATCFEPRSDNIKEIKDNINIYYMQSKVRFVQTAISDSSNLKVKFYSSFGQAEWVKDHDTGNKSSSLLKPKDHLTEHTWCHFKEEEVSTITLDTWQSASERRPFDFLHIDVQGAEMLVFKGAEESLKKVRAIWCEVANIELYEGQPLKKEITEFLADYGFECVYDTCKDKKYGDCFFKRI